MKTVAILQPQYFPWLGVFEQIGKCDEFIHFDNVQLSSGRSFVTRVQVKTSSGLKWLSVPTKRRTGQTIVDAKTDEASSWRARHLATLRASLHKTPYFDDAIGIAEAVLGRECSSLCEINILAIETIARYLRLPARFTRASTLDVRGSKTELLLNILSHVGATRYISGKGGLEYIDHDLFEARGIEVFYADYALLPYPQSWGDFTPFVTSLDAIAACGPRAAALLPGRLRSWRDALSDHRFNRSVIGFTV